MTLTVEILLVDLAPEYSVLPIEPHQDTISRISEAHSPAGALDIVAHGTPGEVRGP